MNNAKYENIMVTGALGHIGSALIRELCNQFKFNRLILLDSLATSRYPSLYNLETSSNLKLINCDVRDNLISLYDDKIDCVIHLAAMTEPSLSAKDPEAFINHNMKATESVLDFCNYKRAKFIGVSSTSIYGTSGQNLTEDDIFKDGVKQSPYAQCKLMEEALIKDYIKNHATYATILRFGTIFGTSIGMRFHTAVNKFCWDASFNGSISVWKTALNQYRPYLDLKDAVSSLIFAMNSEQCCNEVYNVVTSHNTVNDILSIIKEFKPSTKVNLVDSPIMNDLSYTLSTKKFKDIGFTYSGSVKAAISETLNLFKSFS